MRALPITAEGIPDFRRLCDVLMKRTGWQVVAVPGLVPDDVFFEHLAHRRFPAGHFIRKPDELDYLEEPDVFHDVFGHVPMLMNPVIADYIQAYGVGGLRAQQARRPAAARARVLVHGRVRPASSSTTGCASTARASRRRTPKACSRSTIPRRTASRFDLERVMRTRYRIDDFQETYFVLDGLDDLLELAHIDFGPLYERVRSAARVRARRRAAPTTA